MVDATLERIQPIVRGVIEFAGMELVHLEMRHEAGGQVLRLYIDKEGGVTLDDCARVSRQVSAQLDSEDPIPGRYTLEVSSPGLDRPLTSEKDFARFAGRQVKVTTVVPLEGRRNFAGRLVGLADAIVRVVLEDGQEVGIPKDQIAKARLVADHEQVGTHLAARGRHA
jgi:ribosome maturation factor RimP